MVYKKMSDAKIIDLRFFTPGDVDILYTSTSNTLEFMMFPLETKINSNTHIIIGSVTIRGELKDNLQGITDRLQVGFWSPNKEAKPFLNRENIPHRSIDWGDIIRRGDQAFFVNKNTFTPITDGLLSEFNFKRI